MAKTKTVKMPAGIRTKLMAAVAMLLVSTILMVSSTYAWFTLSTAPEVTGITTSVGANGNLEIALLNGYTYEDLERIGSGQGTSTAATGNVTESNITWGNLVDLSDAAYGLNLVALNPAALNHPTEGEGDAKTEDKTKVNTAFLLQTAVYGADGRVADLDANTITGVYNSTNGKWVGTQTFKDVTDPLPAYGVRAIGVDSSMSAAELAMIAAKASVSDGASNAADPVAKAVSANWTTFLTLATSMSDTNPAYSADDVAALKAVAEGVQSSLNAIVKTYSNAVLAELASMEGTTDEVLTAMRSQLSGNTSAATLEALMTKAGVTDDNYSARLTELKDAQTKVAAVLTACGSYANGSKVLEDTDGDSELNNDAELADAIKEQIVKPLIGSTVKAYKADDTEVKELSMNAAMSGDIASVYVSDPNGLVSVVAVDAGTYEMCRVVAGSLEVSVYAGAKDAAAGKLAAVANAVAGMSAPKADENAEKTIADFYGYVIDFAFRTNAAGSKLQLQTTPANRVYSNAKDSNLATQGAGSTATFAYDKSLNTDQVTALLEAVRLVFMNTKDGTIHANGRLTDIDINTPTYTATANVRLLDEKGEEITADNAAIVALDQNEPEAVSVLVYLDGTKVDNGDVANAASSGMLNLNLQFSSSATLIPMENTTLKNMVVTYEPQPETDTDYHVAGLYTYGNVIYTVKDGYDIYKGSDGMTYFSKDDTNYTKLTAISMSEALTPLTVDFAVGKDQDDIIKVGETLDLSVSGVSTTKATVKNVAWSSDDAEVASVAADETTDVVTDAIVTGKAAGTTKINAAIVLEYAVEGSETKPTKTVNAYYTVSVTADEPVAYTVSFNANSGTGTMADVTNATGTYALPACTFTAPENKTFGGWGATADATTYITEVTGATTVYAIWVEAPATPATYKVTYDLNTTETVTGELPVDPTEYNANDTVTVTYFEPTITGYEFLGWSIAQDDTAEITSTNPTFVITEDTTLYAIWKVA